MYSITLKKAKIFLKWTIIIDAIIVPVILLKLLINPWPPTMVINSNVPIANAATVASSKITGPATEQFMQQLKTSGLNPVLAGGITRQPLTVDGKTIMLSGDNIQVFEYADHDSAQTEGASLAQKYTSNSRTMDWKKDTHIYVHDTLLIFYRGSLSSIVSILDKNAGLSLMPEGQYITLTTG